MNYKLCKSELRQELIIVKELKSIKDIIEIRAIKTLVLGAGFEPCTYR